MPEHSLSSPRKPMIEVYPSADQASGSLAVEIANHMTARANEGKNIVIGLATGSTPLPLYRELIRLHREEGLSFQNVITFNLDEYYGLAPDDPQSYHHFMLENLWKHVDLPLEQAHIPSGTIPEGDVAQSCQDYEEAIEAAGGLDLQILGIGRSGHIGFNEPPSLPQSRTRMVELAGITRADAASAFEGLENVPTRAITMGVGTILAAREIFMMAWGENKSEIISEAFKSTPNPGLPASYLQNHDCVHVLLDSAAAKLISNEVSCNIH